MPKRLTLAEEPAIFCAGSEMGPWDHMVPEMGARVMALGVNACRQVRRREM